MVLSISNWDERLLGSRLDKVCVPSSLSMPLARASSKASRDLYAREELTNDVRKSVDL